MQNTGKHLTNTWKGLEKLKTPVKDCKIVGEIRVESPKNGRHPKYWHFSQLFHAVAPKNNACSQPFHADTPNNGSFCKYSRQTPQIMAPFHNYFRKTPTNHSSKFLCITTVRHGHCILDKLKKIKSKLAVLNYNRLYIRKCTNYEHTACIFGNSVPFYSVILQSYFFHVVVV